MIATLINAFSVRRKTRADLKAERV